MAEIIKCYTQKIPATRFIGKKYGDSDRVNGGFGNKWGEWFQNGWFESIESACKTKTCETFKDSGAYIGLMRHKDGEPFQYWIGIFTPEGTEVPEGFEYRDFPASILGVCWVYGDETKGEVYMQEGRCSGKLMENGHAIQSDNGAYWFFERYTCPRFTTPDDKGNVILDICFYIE
ncbi:MAG: hypothetical protein VB118_09845 [Oscillospiraceae bacterium]|nr:hypothetical protein [Oscillospiraceae bacterium]